MNTPRRFAAALLAAAIVCSAGVGRAEEAATSSAPAAPAPALMAGPPVYEIVTVPASETQWNAIKYEVATGKAWKLDQGHWTVIPDTGEVPRGVYKIQMIALRDDWGALRYDVHTGRAWLATVGGWQIIKDGPPSPAE